MGVRPLCVDERYLRRNARKKRGGVTSASAVVKSNGALMTTARRSQEVD